MLERAERHEHEERVRRAEQAEREEQQARLAKEAADKDPWKWDDVCCSPHQVTRKPASASGAACTCCTATSGHAAANAGTRS